MRNFPLWREPYEDNFTITELAEHRKNAENRRKCGTLGGRRRYVDRANTEIVEECVDLLAQKPVGTRLEVLDVDMPSTQLDSGWLTPPV